MPLPSIEELAARAENVRTWEAQKGFQSALFECDAQIICGGGAAGAGKSDGCIVWCAQDYDKPGYRATIFRKSFPELERHIIPRTHALFRDVGRYNSQNHCWTFRTENGGESRLELAYLEKEGDIYNHQGVPNTRFGFDESTRYLTEQMARQLLAWQRTEAENVKCQMGLFTNPIGPGFAWHHHLFIKNRKPFRIYSDATWYEDKRPLEKTTCFIPGRFKDNPINLARNPEYEANLRALPEALRHALLDGSWEQNVGIALDFDPDQHTCDPREIPLHAPRWMSIDWGKDDIACTLWYAYFAGRVYVYRCFKRPGKRIVPYAQEAMDRTQYRDENGLMRRESIMFCVLSHECFADRGSERTQADSFADVFSKFNVPLARSDKDAEGRTMLIREYFRTVPLSHVELRRDLDYEYWVRKFQREGDVVWREYRETMGRLQDGPLPKCLIFRDDGLPEGHPQRNGTDYLISTLPHLVTDEKNAKKLAPKQDDHGFDSLGYGLKLAPMVESCSVDEIYQKILGGRMPESTAEVESAMNTAKEIAGEMDTFKPIDWKR